MQSITNVFAIAKLIKTDGIRRFALWGVVLLALGLELCGTLFVDFIPREIGRASADYILSIGWVTGILLLFFHAIQVIARDDHKSIIHTLLSRPVTRSQYVVGLFVGQALLLLYLNVILSSIGYVSLLYVKKNVPLMYFEFFNIDSYLLSWAGLYLIEMIVLSVIILFSSLVRGGFPVLLLTFSYYLICNGLPVIREFYTGGHKFLSKFDYFFIGLTLLFPDFNRLDFKVLIAQAQNEILSMQLFSSVSLAIVYIVLILFFSSLIYEKRDLG